MVHFAHSNGNSFHQISLKFMDMHGSNRSRAADQGGGGGGGGEGGGGLYHNVVHIPGNYAICMQYTLIVACD